VRNGCGSNPNLACGPYSYTQGELNDQINDKTYSKQILPCLAAIGLSGQTDTRMVGVSMCVAAVNMWRGTNYSAERACDGTAKLLSDLTDQEIRNGVLVYHGDILNTDRAWVNYLSFIDQYKFFVNQVRQSSSSSNNQCAD